MVQGLGWLGNQEVRDQRLPVRVVPTPRSTSLNEGAADGLNYAATRENVADISAGERFDKANYTLTQRTKLSPSITPSVRRWSTALASSRSRLYGDAMLSPTDWIQIVAVLVAVAAAVSALVIATVDRRTQLRIARKQATLSRLSIELEYAVRLSTNRNMGGSSDPAESKRLGAEALALASVVGPRWVPTQYQKAVNGKSPEELRASLSDEDSETPQWVKWKIESGLAVQAIVDEMHSL